MMGLNFKELSSCKEETKVAPKSSRADNRKTFKFPDSPMMATPLKSSQKRKPIITEDTDTEESEESYFEIEDTPELDHPARSDGRTPELSVQNDRS